MLLKLSEHLEKTQPLKRVYRGVVVDNEDPDKLGRVKCTIQGIYPEGDNANLPWIFKNKESQNSFDVPEVGTVLEIRFPTEDVYSGFYYGLWVDETNIDSDFDADYPNTYGFKDSTGTKVIINKTQKTFDFEHTSGIKISMDGDGNLTMEIPKDITETITGDKNTSAENVNLEANADANVTAGGNVAVEGDGTSSFKGTGGTDVGDGSSPTNVDGAVVNLGGGGAPVARLGDTAVGIGVYGVPVTSTIVSGSSKVTSA